MQNKLIVHEWGTFLAVSGSDGVTLEGMYHEEHPLPPFVYQRKGDSTYSRKATLKGETPVIYFYTDRPQKIRVSVDFPTGNWTHWYPMAIRAARNRDPLNQSPLTHGHLGWVAHIAPPSPQDQLPEIAPDSLWRFARQVPQAATVKLTAEAWLMEEKWSGNVTGNGERERFLFYRGLGKSDLPVRFFPEGA
jgi:hypothetical protein